MKEILDYFVEYESNERFMQSSLSGKSGIEYSKEILENPNRIQKVIIEKKVDLVLKEIRKLIKKKYLGIKSIQQSELKNKIEEDLQYRNIDQFIGRLQFNNNTVKKNFCNFALPLLEEDEVTICYPILEKDKIKHPVMTFLASIEENKLSISSFYLNKNSLLILIANSKNIDLHEVERFYNKDISDALNRIEMIQGQDQINEIIKLVELVLSEYFNIKCINSFDSESEWKIIDKVLVTTESLKELYEPPFREEISKVKSKLSHTNESLVNKYLNVNKGQKSYTAALSHTHFHYGSYTAEYPVNKKQWDVVTNVDSTQLLSVNGPPGTGKTTLLKEIIADKFVEKTRELISVWDKSWTMVNEGTKREVYQSPFIGKNKNSIIITSTNNKAVDNIGIELLKEIEYFNEFLSRSEIKGLFCARLGKQKNIDNFKAEVLTPLLNSLGNDHNPQEHVKEEFLAIHNELKGIYNNIEHLVQLASKLKGPLTVTQFEEMKERVQIEYNDTIEKLNLCIKEKQEKNSELDKLNLKQKDLDIEESKIQKSIEYLKVNTKDLYINLKKFESYQKMKFLNKLIKKRRKFLDEYPTFEYIKSLITSEERTKYDLEILQQQILEEINNIKVQKNDIEQKIKEIINFEEELKRTKEEKYLNLSLFKQVTEYKADLEAELDIVVSNLYDIYQIANCKKITAMRNHIFNLSLKVNEEYIKKHKMFIMYNLEKIVEDNQWFKSFYSQSQEFTTNFETGLRALWETFCMVFPVITTTLHSFHSNNFHMLSNLFDLMLVDEAGQILPHYIIGPLYRTNRAVVVGDVFQLEPIRLQDNKLIDKYQSIDESIHNIVCVESNSVQSFSDVRSDIYEQIGKNKVGVILEEHRRCENNIVQFSNQFVYGGKLSIVKKDNHDKPFGRNLIAFDVRGKHRKDNVNELEVVMCERVIEHLCKSGLKHSDIAIITPYKNQVKYLSNTIKNIDIGTIHTFQGQEKKVILFSSVIEEADNSRFVGSKPNMLNVAFTRAKEQFIWIGNINAALQSNNYLQNAAKVVRKSGIIYSIYDTSLNNNVEGMQMDQAMSMYSGQISYESTLLNRYILDQFNEGIVKGPSKHYSFLQKVLEHAKSSIIIISPWITNYVVDENFLDKVTQLINKDVTLKVMFGYHQSDYDLNQLDRIASLDYKGLSSSQITNTLKNLHKLLGDQLIYKPPMHTKLLLIDQKYLVIGSYNWLSNSGAREGAKDEISCIITERRYIDSITEFYKPL